MTRGISKQVIVVAGNTQDFYENAIFILKADRVQEGISGKQLLKQAQCALVSMNEPANHSPRWRKVLWALGGFAFSCGLWVLVLLL